VRIPSPEFAELESLADSGEPLHDYSDPWTRELLATNYVRGFEDVEPSMRRQTHAFTTRKRRRPANGQREFCYTRPLVALSSNSDGISMSIESDVESYYTRGRLEDSILQALTRAGKDLANLTHGDLAALDEFHAGGREATEELAAQMELRTGLHLLDVGSGIGGRLAILPPSTDAE